jgi:hypothetical protein
MTVNLSLLGGAGWQFSDNNGLPLSGGLLYTYQAGTALAANTYTSASGVTPNSNPVVLNATGRVVGEIWLTQGQAYKFVLKTSAGVTLGTYDNVPGANDPNGIYVALAAASGSSLIGYQPLVGSAITVQTELRALDASVVTLTAADATFALKGANTDITSLASPALGAATATTQTAGNNTTKVATTAFVAANSLGFAQTWQIVVRTAGVSYTNSTGKPIVLQISASCTTGSNIAIFCDGLTLATYEGATASPIYGTISAIVPNGSIYGYTSTGAPTSFTKFELR